MILKTIFIFFIAFVIYLDFSKTKAQLKAKIFHVLAILFLLYTNFSSLISVFRLLREVNFLQNLKVQVGVISPTMNLYQNLIYIVFGCVIVILVMGMINRSDFARRNLIIILPFLIPSNVISFYIGVKQNFVGANDYLILLIGLFIFTCIYLIIFFLYRSEFMISFFKAKYIKR